MRGHWSCVQAALHLPGGKRIITCSYDGSLRLWDLESGAQIGEELRDEGDTAAVSTMAMSPNGKMVASGTVDGIVRLWELETETIVAKWTGHAMVNSVCWSSDGARVLSGFYDGTVRVWDVESQETVLGPIKTGHKEVYVVTNSPDTTRIATGGKEEDAIKIWDTKTSKLLCTLKHNSTIKSLAWTWDGEKLISGSVDGSIKIFDTTTWQQVVVLKGHEHTVNTLSLFQNNRLLATASDFTAYLWNLDTNLPVGPLLQHEATVSSAAISADGKLLLTGCLDTNAQVWDIHTVLKSVGHEDLISIPDVGAL
jgi:WD40 repeat protein